MNGNDLIGQLLGSMSLLEWFGALTGILAVYLAVRVNIWTWFWGVLSCAAYSYVFWQFKLYSSMALFLLYFLPMQFYGWWSWKKNGEETELPVTYLGVLPLLPYLLGVGIFTGGWGWWMAQNQAALPYVDAAQTGMSIVAQYLMARKKVECWWLWSAVNLICAFLLYPSQKLYVTAGLFLVYLALAILGLLQWMQMAGDTVQSAEGTSSVRKENQDQVL